MTVRHDKRVHSCERFRGDGHSGWDSRSRVNHVVHACSSRGCSRDLRGVDVRDDDCDVHGRDACEHDCARGDGCARDPGWRLREHDVGFLLQYERIGD